MYLPAAFSETDLPRLHDFMAAHSFATVVSLQHGATSSEPVASHLPLLLDRAAGTFGTLQGHFARANRQWELAAGATVLVIFQGPHAYVSPAWMDARNVVPTWNYVAVHAYGRMTLLDDQRSALAVRRMVEHYEGVRSDPWPLESVDRDFIEKMLAGIVAFEIEIVRLEGKWKLNQNHPRERREHIARGLRASNDPQSREIAELMDHDLARSAVRDTGDARH